MTSEYGVCGVVSLVRLRSTALDVRIEDSYRRERGWHSPRMRIPWTLGRVHAYDTLESGMEDTWMNESQIQHATNNRIFRKKWWFPQISYGFVHFQIALFINHEGGFFIKLLSSFALI